MSLKVDFICRLCLDSGKLRCISKTVKMYGSVKTSFSEMIASIASVPVDESDGLPNRICIGCISKLKAAYAFKKQCEHSYKVLLEIRSNNKNDIKQEPVDISSVVSNNSDDIKMENVKLERDDSIRNGLEESNSTKRKRHRTGSNDDDFSNVSLGFDTIKVETITDNDNNDDDDDDDDDPESDMPISSLRKIGSKLDKNKNEKDDEPKKLDKVKERLGIDVNSMRMENGRYQCNQCLKTHICKSSFVRHLESHLGIKSYYCEICQKSFSRKWSHMRSHSRPQVKRFQCDKCEKMFVYEKSLNLHIQTHSDEKPHICDDCGKAFKRSDRLAFHKRTHTNIKDFICQFCSREFTMKKYLLKHIQYKHTEGRRYQCKLCEKTFSTSECLRTHEKRHLGIKNHQCDMCKKKFVSASDLNMHRKRHSKEKIHGCRVCDARFSRPDHRNRHETMTHGMDFRSQKYF